MSANTDRIYLAAQTAFIDWCQAEHRVSYRHDTVAAYLLDVLKTRGPNAVPVHLSAIASMFRAVGRPLDTKSDVIQEVVMPARRQMGP